MTWRHLRIAILLAILVFVALGTWLDRVYTTDWRTPLGVALYPVPGDDSATVQSFVAALENADFAAVEAFFAREGARYGIPATEPVRLWLSGTPASRPPLLDPGANLLEGMLYSLRLRLHAWRALSGQPGPTPHVRMYLLLHDPERSPVLPHSLGLERGLVGVVHLFADPGMRGSNQVVLAHEILHTLGATDKYSLDDGQPIHPDGYAEPGRDPLHPQTYAELMGGRIPLSATEAVIPNSLTSVVVGPRTAQEIRWLRE
ncbi:MAG TPA: hypothetical protein VLT59_13985 [Steroidobacteraceae bacterium]|nr:hypothetical protein [Steroidobacteraceae bacterium]